MTRLALGVALLAGGCACGDLYVASDAGADAGVDAEVVLTSCDDFLRSPGAPCVELPTSCTEGPPDTCAARLARCVDGFVVIEEDVWASYADPSECVVGAAAVEARGFGAPVTFDNGLVGGEAGFTNALFLLLGHVVTYAACASPRMTIFFRPNDDGSYAGTMRAEARVLLEEEIVSIPGQVHDVEHDLDTGRITGAASFVSGERIIEGTFDLVVCPELVAPSL